MSVRKKMYTINFMCDNCGCSTSKSYKKGTKAPSSVDCSNCGCSAHKTVGYPTPPVPYKKREEPWEPYIKPWIKPPEDTYPPWADPWKPYKKIPQDDWFPQNPKATWYSLNSNHVNDAGTILC